MKQNKHSLQLIVYGILAIVVVLLAVPSVLVSLSGGPAQIPVTSPDIHPDSHSVPADTGQQKTTVKTDYPVRIFRVEFGRVDTVNMENYVTGVVSAEMPAEFEPEALKAQALAARTFIVGRMLEGKYSDVPKGAYVTDTVKHQVYYDDAQLHQKWGASYSWRIQKIRQAVTETAGQVIAYQNKPIDATFFSTSNGYTENSEDYWGSKIPYLRSVPVPWDKNAPRFDATVTLSMTEFEKKLGTKITMTASTGNGGWAHVDSLTAGKRVNKIRIGDKEYTGREVREKLGLNSSQFSFQTDHGSVIIHTKGYGHGVGMSQWGANGMAQQGKKAEEIVKYFYQGVSIETEEKWLKKTS
ncbi:stage II sporulation protein D [Aneurinibacillus sp. Ricciae_BoGa-3]|uniref:stage II sporulation protein D n=1 Tax=Aneurinibacillus sp. Ricciae_BoGa-3 TaxID=3022697 RepID=UPI002341EFF8|nr:stage II sporulation protein D [Aneurinibacillus sp. Ricciae_BoGa-3]WCK54319.1 stage II sporulation protein D [Aneurinibacillus sp. Ricciae_BoGa-3]